MSYSRSRLADTASVFLTKLSFSQTEEETAELILRVSNERQKKALSLKQNKERLRCVFAELLLRYALMSPECDCDKVSEKPCTLLTGNVACYAETCFLVMGDHTGTVINAIDESLLAKMSAPYDAYYPSFSFKYGEHGKPFLSEACGFSPVPFFNLSHSGDYVACVIANAPCGIDIQKLKPIKNSLVNKVCSPAEQKALDKLSGKEKEMMFFKFWTLKEAYIKADGRGLSLPLNKAAFRIREDGLAYLVHDGGLPEKPVSTAVFTPEKDYACAVAFMP